MQTKLLAVLLMMGSGCSDYKLSSEEDANIAEPDILVSPDSLAFHLPENVEGEQLRLTLTNQGSAALQVGALVIDGSAFTIQGVAAPFELPPGESIQTWVQYVSEAATDSGTLFVISNDPDSPEMPVPLVGSRQGPILQIEPPSFSFEEQLLDCSAETTFTLRNVGSGTLELGPLSVGEDFVITELPEQSTLAPSEQVALSVSFTPEAERLYEGALVVDSNDPSGPGSAGLVGVGDADGTCRSLSLTFDVEHNVADVAFILDTTTSMGATAAAMGSEFTNIAEELSDTLDDVTFGVAVHRDYAPPIGINGDLPFILLTQQTSDLDRVSDVLSDIPLVGGGYDMPEASYEALIQATTGRGFDDRCDGEYDERQDVPPFIRSTDDAFGGTEGGVYSAAVQGTGDRGGMGFREGALPIIILATDAAQKDADSGTFLMPDGCPEDATKSGVLDGLDALGARLIGIGVRFSPTSQKHQQLSEVADMMTTWSGTGDIQGTIVRGVQALLTDITFDEVWLEIASDEHSQVDAVQPSRWKDVHTGTDVTFELIVNSAIAQEPREDTYPVLVEVYGRIDSDEWLLDAHTFHVIRP